MCVDLSWSKTVQWIASITIQLKLFTQASSVLMSGRKSSVLIMFLFFFHPQKEEKSQQRKVQNGFTDCIPAQTPLSPKPSSPDALKASIASLATISNINIDIQLQDVEDMVKRQVQRPQSVVSHHRVDNEPVTHSVYKDSKGRGKSDPSPPPSPVKPPLKSVSGVGRRGGDERRASNGLLDIHPQATPNPGDTFSVCGEKQMSDDKDDTMELLKEAEMQNQQLEVEKEAAFSIPDRRSAHKPNIENPDLEVNVDNKNDTVTLLKGAPTQHHTSDIQVSAPRNTAVFFLFFFFSKYLFTCANLCCCRKT